MMRSYKFRMYPTKGQAAELSEMLGTFCWLYNRALEERRDAWRFYGWSYSYFDQTKDLTRWRKSDERLGRFGADAEAQVLRRLDNAFKAFFRRVKAGEKPGFPRFKPAARFDAAVFRYAQGCTVSGDRVNIAGIIPAIRFKKHRAMDCRPQGCTIKREGRRWFLICHANVEAPETVDRPHTPVGIDAGLTSLVALTTGETVATPQWTAKSAKRIRRHSRALSRAKLGSKRRRKAKERLAAAHRRAARQRSDFLHKLSHRIVRGHSHIAVEDLSVASMARSRFGKSIHNAAWATLRNFLTYKAESAGGIVVAVRPHGTSQACSGCGVVVQKALKVRTHDCPHCGLVLDRDLNAARNILALADFRPGTGHRDISEPVAA